MLSLGSSVMHMGNISKCEQCWLHKTLQRSSNCWFSHQRFVYFSLSLAFFSWALSIFLSLISLRAHLKSAHIHYGRWMSYYWRCKVILWGMRWPLAFWFWLQEFPWICAMYCNCIRFDILLWCWCTYSNMRSHKRDENQHIYSAIKHHYKVWEYLNTIGPFPRKALSLLLG